MNTVTIYHNPRCSKSRAALQILEEKGYAPTIIEYLKQGLTGSDVKQLLTQLNLSITDIIRNSEGYFKAQKLERADGKTLLQHLIQEPKLLQRPIVIYNNKAIIARPPERVLEIL